MSLKLQTLNETPPGGWRYKIPGAPPDVAWVGPYHAFTDLLDAVKLRCAANGTKIPANVAEDIQDQLCQVLPPGRCVDINGMPFHGAKGLTNLSIDQIKQATNTLASWFFQGRQRVSNDEIHRRTMICAACPHNQPYHCASCAEKGLRDIVNSVVAGSELPTDSLLRVCTMCGCSLKAKSRLTLDLLHKHMGKEQLSALPDHCWLKPKE